MLSCRLRVLSGIDSGKAPIQLWNLDSLYKPWIFSSEISSKPFTLALFQCWFLLRSLWSQIADTFWRCTPIALPWASSVNFLVPDLHTRDWLSAVLANASLLATAAIVDHSPAFKHEPPKTTAPPSVPLEQRCVNPVCTPGQACPEYRCPITAIPIEVSTTTPIVPTTAVILPITTAHCVNPVCTPGQACPEYVCACKFDNFRWWEDTD
jgi:hypothetical protein